MIQLKDLDMEMTEVLDIDLGSIVVTAIDLFLRLFLNLCVQNLHA
jgi:hypothetical protein